MRKLILLAVLTMACIVTKTMAHPGHLVDSTKIIHANDGDISEWGAGRFETDPELKLLYSIDHDNENLYMAMKITDPAMQMRIAMNGMKMFIDTRGKKKEGTGIEFPIRKDGSGFPGGRGQGGGPAGGYGNEGAPDPAKLQQRMAFNMIVLKVFGFDDKEDKTQFIGESGSVNIAYKWDADGSMGIEYRIPLEYVGGTSSLKNKSLSIGWKVNEASAQASGATRTETNTATREVASTTSTGGGGRRGNGAGGASSSAGGRGGGGGDPRVANDEPKGQFIWTKHLMIF